LRSWAITQPAIPQPLIRTRGEVEGEDAISEFVRWEITKKENGIHEVMKWVKCVVALKHKISIRGIIADEI